MKSCRTCGSPCWRPERPPCPPGSAGQRRIGVGVNRLFLGRGVCPRGFISATRVGGHCHGDHSEQQISLKWGTWEPGSQALLVLPGTFSEKNAKLAPLNRPLELPGTFNGKSFKLIKCACWSFQKCLAECGRYENNKCMCLLAYSICDADHVPDD